MQIKDPEGMANMLREATGEIRQLRQRNQVLQAVSDTVDAFRSAMRGTGASVGYGQDVTHRMEKAAEHLKEVAAASFGGSTGGAKVTEG